MIKTLDGRGYFEHAFEKDCVDAPAEVIPSELLETLTGRPNLWPIDPPRLAADTDSLFDLIEALHDLVARPRDRYEHNYAGCGYHYASFSVGAGRSLYTWRVNRLLDRSDLSVRLATEGEDSGRLVEVTDDARQVLTSKMIERTDRETGDQVRHAIALFRRRGATDLDKKSAILSLVGVLEDRRQNVLKIHLARKDEGALFAIANEFALRHQRAGQQKDYDPVFLDWVFWSYLATVELSDRLIAREMSKTSAGD